MLSSIQQTFSEMSRVKVWLDCDPGHDDAMAIMLAGYHPSLHLLGISTSAGNQTIAKTTTNALRILEVSGLRHVEVVAGMSKPLIRKPSNCPEIHGDSGLDGPTFPPLTLSALNQHAILRMAQTFSEHKAVTLIATGPLTNVALLLIMFPEVKSRISRIVLMGGAIGVGNTGPAAEFNIQVDPEAAHVVFESGVPVTMIPLEIVSRIRALGWPNRQGPLTVGDCHSGAPLSAVSPFSELVVSLLHFFAATYKTVFGFDHPPLHDPCAVAFVIQPEIFQTKLMRVDVEMCSPLSYGQTVCDIYAMSPQPKNVQVAVSMDVPAFWNLMLSALHSANQISVLNSPSVSIPVQQIALQSRL